MSESFRLLELGIGKGGPKILQDAPGVVKIGADVDSQALRVCQERYGIEVQLLDELAIQTVLPFDDYYFQQIDINFPTGRMLYCLMYGEVLWPEMRRILSPSGTVNIVTEVKDSSYHIINVDSEQTFVRSPDLIVAEAARRHGFATEIQPVNEDCLRDLGTEYALRAIEWIKNSTSEIYKPRVSLITARRRI